MTISRLTNSIDAPAQHEFGATSDNLSWNALGRLGFRFASSYLVLSWFAVYGVLQVIPWIGGKLEGGLDQLWSIPVLWIGVHMFHLTGIAAQFHPTDSRDTALDWITVGLVIPAALLATVFWSILDRRRKNYRTAAVWLRYILRLALIFLMLRYALIKIFPMQMAPPSLAVLNEPLGNTSPMTLLWTTLGLHPGYEMLAGWIEGTAALLLAFRRTALLGALLTVFIMSNVLLYNLFFDVPVKLGAANVLLLAVAVTIPDLRTLWNLFVLHRTDDLTTPWAPSHSRRGVKLLVVACEFLFVTSAFVQFIPGLASAYAQQRANLRQPSPLAGEWHVDSVLRNTGNGQIAEPILTGLGRPMIDLIIEPEGLAMARATDGMLWRVQASVDSASHTLTLGSGLFEGLRFNATYSIGQPDARHIVLEPQGAAAGVNGTIVLSRVELLTHYPLLERKFHWVNEWALER